MFYRYPLSLPRKSLGRSQTKNSAHNELASAIEAYANNKVSGLSEGTVTHFDIIELIKATRATQDEIFYALGGNHGFDLGR